MMKTWIWRWIAGECPKEVSKFATQRNQPLAHGQPGIIEDVKVRMSSLDLSFRNADGTALYHLTCFPGVPLSVSIRAVCC